MNDPVAEIESQIETVNNQFIELSSEEIDINTQIAELRKRLDDVRRTKTSLRLKQNKLKEQKASAERIRDVEEKQKRLQAEQAQLEKELEQLLHSAKWWPPKTEGDSEKIFQYQVDGALRLAIAGRGLLGDTRGMGKTLTSLAWRRGVKAKRTLFLSQKSYLRDLIQELHYWEPDLTIIPMVGSDTTQRKALSSLLSYSDNVMVVANIEMWRRSEKAVQELLGFDFDSLILDEAHKIKTAKSSTTQGYFTLAHNIPNVLEMTGTPVQNKPQELFALLHALYPELFPDERAFRLDYCTQMRDDYGVVIPNRWTWRPGGLSALLDKMSTFYIARSPDDVGHKIPPPRAIRYSLDLTNHKEQERAYKQIAARSLVEIDSERVATMRGVLDKLTRLAQVVSWPSPVTFVLRDEEGNPIGDPLVLDVRQSVKVDWAEDLITELTEEGRPVVLFSRFKPALHEIQRRLLLKGIRTGLITGDISDREKSLITQDFDLKRHTGEAKYDVILGTYQAMGESLNLNRAADAILFDRYWKPAADDQAAGRIDRINSIQQATLHIPTVEKTVDVFMEELIEGKRNMLTSFNSAAEVLAKLRKSLENSIG